MSDNTDRAAFMVNRGLERFVAEIDGESVYLGSPDGRERGFYRYDESDDWLSFVPLSPRQMGDRDRLRDLRLEAARLSGGDVETAKAIFDFLRIDA